MKKRVISATLVLLLSVAAFAGCDDDSNMTSGSYDYKSDISAIVEILDTTDEKYSILVNKDKMVDADYDPGQMVKLDDGYTNGGKTIEVEKNVKAAVQAMIDEMRAHGIEGVCVTSGYRSYAYQEWLFNYYIEEEMLKDTTLTRDMAEKKVLTYSARPGTSEHHTGLCVDLWVNPDMRELENYGSEGEYDDVGFAETEAFKWLKDNAHKFGFILRFPENKTDITGYSYESWHYRFVGIPAAAQIYEKGITLEEYLG